MKGWDHALNSLNSNSNDWALYAKSILDRTRLALTNKAEKYQSILQPTAEYLGSQLGVDQWAVCTICLQNQSICLILCIILLPCFCAHNYIFQVDIFTEEIIRAGSAASLSTLLNRLDPVLRKTANLGRLTVLPLVIQSYHV